MSAHADPHAAHVESTQHLPATSGSFAHESMQMYFHFGLGDTLLFKSLVLNQPRDLLVACFVFFVIATLYEALKSYRVTLMVYAQQRQHVANVNRLMESTLTERRSSAGGTGNISPGETHYVPNDTLMQMYPDSRFPGRHLFNKFHVLQSVLHMLQVLVSYTLMLGFMSFNVCICFAILLGAGVGYLCFCWRKMSFEMATEHCH